MKRALMFAVGIFLGVVAAVTLVHAAHQVLPAYITAAVSDPARPESDTKRDADRKPAECLAFAGVKPGERVADLVPGGGYFTRLFSAVVGPSGRVYAVAPPSRPGAAPDAPPPAAPVQALAADPHYGNVTVLVQKFDELALPENLDLVWTSRNYHDFHNIPNVNVVDIDKAILKALKPGGIYIVLDHVAPKGSGFSETSNTHRIDPEAVKTEVVSAGFKYVGASNVLHNPQDPHTEKVFDSSIKDHTDQFILKFEKPK